MKRTLKLRVMGLLLAGAWLPVSITCNPARGQAIRVFGNDRYYGEIIIEEDCDDCWADEWGFDGWWDGFHFDFWYDD